MAGHLVYLGIGGNLGDREANLEEARMCIDFNIGPVVQASPVVESPAWGMKDAPPFLNQVLAVETTLSVEELMNEITELEAFFGRERKTGGEYSSREMDVDILFYDQLVREDPEAHIPHPRMHLRRFVLVPMVALAPELRHPVLGSTMSELLSACPDEGQVSVRHDL